MCFGPQLRALFRHLNFQKPSDAEVFCTCSLQHVLRATTGCTFLTSQRPKVFRERCVLHMFTSKCAPRHNGVHFFIFHLCPAGSAPAALASLLLTRLSYLSRTCIFFLRTFSISDLLRVSDAFQLPNFLRLGVPWTSVCFPIHCIYITNFCSTHKSFMLLDLPYPKVAIDHP